jgi:isocitrate lyase
MDSEYDDSDLCRRADDKIKTFQMDSAKLAFSITYYLRIIQQHFIWDLAQGYFGEEGMLAYVKVFRDKKFAKELPV